MTKVPVCRKIKFPSKKDQHGGYPKNFRLQKKRTDSRFERSFTQVLEDGTTRGKYIGYDYVKDNDKGDYRMQGTSWLSSVKKAYRQNCTDYRESLRLGMILEDFNIPDEEWPRAEQIWKGLSKEEQLPYREAAIQIQCNPMEILLRETTPGNVKANFKPRERKYYVESIPAGPIRVTPSSGPTPRIYRFNPKVYPMKIDETIEEFKERKGFE